MLVSGLNNLNFNLRYLIAYPPLPSVLLRKQLQWVFVTVQAHSLQHLINQSYGIHSCSQCQFKPYSDYMKCYDVLNTWQKIMPLAFHIQHPKLASIFLFHAEPQLLIYTVIRTDNISRGNNIISTYSFCGEKLFAI